jgi:hypothetical protein
VAGCWGVLFAATPPYPSPIPALPPRDHSPNTPPLGCPMQQQKVLTGAQPPPSSRSLFGSWGAHQILNPRVVCGGPRVRDWLFDIVEN